MAFNRKLLVAFSLVCITLAAPQTAPPTTVTCKNVVSGNISGVNGESKGWSFDGIDELIYNPNATPTATVAVTFQACTPNPGGFTNTAGGLMSGHLTVPSLNSCLAVPDPDLLLITKTACSTQNDASQPPITWVWDPVKKQLTWTGHTTADGKVIEGGDCGTDGKGFYGYEGVKKPLGQPNLGAQEVKCISSKTAARAFAFILA